MILTRPERDSTPEEVRGFFTRFAAALTAEGVAHGQEFSVSAVRPVDANAVIAGSRDTSRSAAMRAYPKSGSQRWTVLRVFVKAGSRGMIREGVEVELRLSGNSVRPRIDELVEGGWLIRTQATRLTATGAEAEVLVASERAIRAVQDESSRSVTAGTSKAPTAAEEPPVPTTLFGNAQPHRRSTNAIYQGD